MQKSESLEIYGRLMCTFGCTACGVQGEQRSIALFRLFSLSEASKSPVAFMQKCEESSRRAERTENRQKPTGAHRKTEKPKEKHGRMLRPGIRIHYSVLANCPVWLTLLICWVQIDFLTETFRKTLSASLP